MEFRALGPLTIQRDGEQVDLGSHKQQAVLALLLINANQTLSVDRILEEIWGADGDGKVNALHVYVSRLRSALEPNRRRGDSSILETRGTSYRLNVDPDRFDVARFEQEIANGRALLATDPGAAAASLEAALNSWHGTPFEDFAYEEFAQAECRRLNDLRLHALEDRLEADLARGLSGELGQRDRASARSAPAPRAARQPSRPGAVSRRPPGRGAAGDRPFPPSCRRGTRDRPLAATAAARRTDPAARRQHPAASSRPRQRCTDQVRRHQPVQRPACLRAVRRCDVLRSRRIGGRDPPRAPGWATAGGARRRQRLRQVERDACRPDPGLDERGDRRLRQLARRHDDARGPPVRRARGRPPALDDRQP